MTAVACSRAIGDHGRGGAVLADMCPRIAAAREGFCAAEVAWYEERHRLISERCRLEALVAHRDLQVIRSESRGRARRDGRYMAYRQQKLARAETDLYAVVTALTALRLVAPGQYRAPGRSAA